MTTENPSTENIKKVVVEILKVEKTVLEKEIKAIDDLKKAWDELSSARFRARSYREQSKRWIMNAEKEDKEAAKWQIEVDRILLLLNLN